MEISQPNIHAEKRERRREEREREREREREGREGGREGEREGGREGERWTFYSYDSISTDSSLMVEGDGVGSSPGPMILIENLR